MRTLVRVLAIGFTAVIVSLAAAAVIGANNVRSIVAKRSRTGGRSTRRHPLAG